jgi:hypothetical protein
VQRLGTVRCLLKSNDVLDLPGHVIATFLQLHYSLAAVASLPTLLLGHLNQTVSLLVLWAFSLSVEFAVAQYADLCVACAASCVLSTVCRIHFDLGWLDPLATSLCRAVKAVTGGVLLEFFVPKDFELVVEQPVGILEGNVL